MTLGIELSTDLPGLFELIRSGFKGAVSRLRESQGGGRPAKFNSVSSFWYEGVDEQALSAGASVVIEGVISPYVVATPLHPSAVPGRQSDRWPIPSAPLNDFAHSEFFLWNDGILSLPATQSRKGILGLNDKYGLIGHGCLPVIVDLNNTKLKAAYENVIGSRPASFECKVTGRLTNFMSSELKVHWANFLGARDTEPAQLTKPVFVLEATALSLGKPRRHLRGMVWLGLTDQKVSPVYCDISDYEAHSRAITALNAVASNRGWSPVALYDTNPITPWSGPIPRLNEELQESFRGF